MSALRHPDWHLLSEQRFRRRAAITTTQQTFRGQGYVVLSDRVTGTHLRLSERARQVWALLDGRRTLDEVWQTLMQRPAIAPSQGEIVEWVMQLVGSGLILSDHRLDPKYLSERSQKRRVGAVEQRLVSPLAVKIKLFDPSWIVNRTYPLVAPLFTRAGGVLVLAVLVTAIALAVLHMDALLTSADQALLSQSGLLGLALVYPVMKALHELAHCYALKRFGGQVREFGIMLLIFFPVPYVEASEATALPDKRARMLVAAAGIVAELLIASVALILWLQIEPGVERAILFNFVVIGSVSTLLFNGNPLLKFDAYFVLADLIEMPNLAQRSGEFLQDRFLSVILGLRREVWPPVRDARILATYGVLSVAYRLLLTLTIALLVSTWFFIIGILLAIWAVVMGVGWPLIKLYRKGVRMAKSQNRRRRVLLRLMLFGAAVGVLVTGVPLPFSAPGEGRIVPVPGAVIAAQTSGFVAPADAPDGARVGTGERLMRLANPDQTARLTTVQTNVAALEDALTRSGLTVAERQRVERQLDVARTALREAELRQDALVVRAPMDGRLSWQSGRTAPAGSFVFRGDRLGHVVAAGALEVIVAIPVAYSGRAGAATMLDVRLPDGTLLERRVDRARVIDVGQPVPPGLLSSAGGPIPEQPDNPGMALDSRWVLWASPEGDLSAWSGARVQARIDLGTASVFAQARFHVQRLFLRVNRF